jgi:hypothetical protein
MKPSQLTKYLHFAMVNKLAVLIKGKPGIGKSDIVEQASELAGFELIIDHPVISDPTDFKGLPFATDGEAHFLPFKNLRKIIEADRPTVYFLDDLGQAPASVQAAVMQLLLARKIGEHKVSEQVTFVAATNRKEDKAAVSGLLEPVKSRFRGGIIELEVDTNDWLKWALGKGDMPLELIAFIRFKPDILNQFVPSKDIVNYASPRTVASVGLVQNAGLPQELEHEVFKGIAGEAFATEYRAFLKLMRELPSLDEIIMNPKSAKLPESAGQTYALCAGLANRASEVNIEPIITYTERLKPEFSVACIKDATIRHPEITQTRPYIKWSIDKQELVNI